VQWLEIIVEAGPLNRAGAGWFKHARGGGGGGGVAEFILVDN